MENPFTESEIKRVTSQFRTSAIAFPTDSVSVSNLKTLSPSDFDWNFKEHNSFTERDSFSVLLDDALHYERVFAAFVFCKQKGLPAKSLTDYDGSDKRELIELLHASYQSLGISSSIDETLHHAQQIEAQVIKLASVSSPQHRSR